MATAAWFGAYWLRFNLDIPDDYVLNARRDLPYVLVIQAFLFWFFGIYRGVWRFSSLPDLIRITKAVSIGVCTIGLSFFLYNRLGGVPRAALPLYFFLLLVFLCIPRFGFRFWKENVLHERVGKRTLIVGAGAAGEMLVRDLHGDRNSGYIPLAFVDDDTQKRKREVRGLRIVGDISKIPKFVERLNLDIVLIAVPSATDSEMRRIIDYCENCQVPFQTLPSVKELLTGSISRGNLRDVSIEDILGRKPVRLDWNAIKTSLHDKCILVTGGGGSIGSELCKQIARVGPAKLIIFDQSEYNLYKINAKMANQFPELNHCVVLGDVTDRPTVKQLIESCKPDIIFHAAAYKHVPLLENQAREAVHNNVVGTQVIAEIAIANRIKRFILISTDKAVNPTNVMGATKRAAEILCQNLNDENCTRFTTVRFGNVLDSAGSVVPLFREQIQAGGPVTVTHAEICRYFMTIPEACQLIMKSATVGQGGEIYVLDMGEPIKITYLAEQMIRLSGKKPGTDIEIKYIGLRPGEKLYEELFYEQEKLLQTEYEKLLLAQARRFDKTTWMVYINELAEACKQDSESDIIDILKKIVPEYCKNNQP
jgi:FlaA1/EpsC-like NDP-sugar epimerase